MAMCSDDVSDLENVSRSGRKDMCSIRIVIVVHNNIVYITCVAFTVI